MKFFNKFRLLGLLTCCILLLTACSKQQLTAEETQSQFDAYLESLPSKLLDGDDMSLEFLFNDPQKFGIEDQLYVMSYADEESYEEIKKESNEILNDLDEYQYEDLTDDQKLTYDILKDNLERSLPVLEYYHHDNSYLGSIVSFQAQLPLLLNEFTFEKQRDLDNYFNILKSSKETFHKYYLIELERQQAGTGMPKSILDKAVEQCENLTKTDRFFLIDSINEKIDQVDFLNEDQKSQAKQKNEDLLTKELLPAYENLKEELKTLTPDERNLGLASRPNGKEYYEALLRQRSGLDMSVNEVKSYLNKKNSELIEELKDLLQKYPAILADYDFNDIQYSEFTNFNQTLDYLHTRMLEDFPEIDQLNYNVYTVDDSMKDNFSPAAYVQSRLDTPISQPESIYINGAYDQSLFPTIAHEGYPGHMYQNVYFKSQSLPTIRSILDYNGYSEGWATYVEKYANKYVQTSQPELLKLYELNQELTKIEICLMDIGIHYEGWNYDQFKEKIIKSFGEMEEENIKSQYDNILEIPTNYLQYYLTGFQFDDMYNRAKLALQDKFDPVSFHEVILKTGPSSFQILNQQIDKYIEEHK